MNERNKRESFEDALYKILAATSKDEVAKHGPTWTVEQIHIFVRYALFAQQNTDEAA